MNFPKFITFTGVDRFTSILDMLALSARYPIEWGVLFSQMHQGDSAHNRYPPIEFIYDLAAIDMQFSAHLCGEAAEQVRVSGNSQHDGFLHGYFQGLCRAQINTAKPVDIGVISRWARELKIQAIVQSRDATTFPTDSRVHWLYDTSGGRGIAPGAWPTALNGDVCHGYAGGLNPDNVAGAVQIIGHKAGAYYLDMESGVRNEADRFDLGRCRRVCEAVYGS